MTGPLVRCGERTVPLAEVKSRALRVARGLRDAGIGEGDVLAVMMRNDIPFLEAMLGARIAGVYAVPVNWHFGPEEAAYILQDSEAKALLVHADLVPQLTGAVPRGMQLWGAPTPAHIAAAYGVPEERRRVPMPLEDWDSWVAEQTPWEGPPAMSRGVMFYTSGTTGNPKGVMREPVDEERREAYSRINHSVFGLENGGRMALTGPLYHSAPSAYTLQALDRDCDIWLTPRFDPEALLRLIDVEKITHLHMVPTMFVRLLHLPEAVRKKYDVSSVEWAVHGAAPCPPEVKRAMIDWWGPVIHEYYGSTEVSVVCHATSEESIARPGTVGKILPTTHVRIYGEDGRVLPPGETGEVYVKQDLVPGFTYHKLPEKRAEVERDDGFITNGDVGYLDEDGYLYLNDRKRDMIISGGVNIYPAEIEMVLVQHPAVRDCAVFGIPDEEFGESIAAAVTFKDSETASEDELRAFLAEHLSGFKLPKVIAVHDALPREDSGKIFKRKLREPYWEQAGRRI